MLLIPSLSGARRKPRAACILYERFPMKVIIIFASVALVLAVLILVVNVIRRNAGVPSLDDPKQVAPPPARDMSQNE